MDIGIVAGARFPITEPFVGGLEMHTHVLATELRRRGHHVTVYAAGGSGPYDVSPMLPVDFAATVRARQDVSSAPAAFVSEHHSYLDAIMRLVGAGHDVVHLNSFHYLPFASAAMIPSAMTATLHSPPTVWMESALALADRYAHQLSLISVSRANASLWTTVVVDTVIHNGIDLHSWPQGTGGERAVWFGRIVPEKAPHLALDAARLAGVPIDIAGPIHDEAYFEGLVAPRLGRHATYLGHLHIAELAAVVGSASVSVITPQWEEPFGLVIPESLACGTPVAAFDRGAVPELVDDTTGRIAVRDDVAALAVAIRDAGHLERGLCRRAAEQRFSAKVMVDGYERRFHEAVRCRRDGLSLAAPAHA